MDNRPFWMDKELNKERRREAHASNACFAYLSSDSYSSLRRWFSSRSTISDNTSAALTRWIPKPRLSPYMKKYDFFLLNIINFLITSYFRRYIQIYWVTCQRQIYHVQMRYSLQLLRPKVLLL